MNGIVDLVVGQAQNNCQALLRILLQLLLSFYSIVFGCLPLRCIETLLVESFFFFCFGLCLPRYRFNERSECRPRSLDLNRVDFDLDQGDIRCLLPPLTLSRASVERVAIARLFYWRSRNGLCLMSSISWRFQQMSYHFYFRILDRIFSA